MDLLWIVLGLLVAAVGGWPVTGGVLKLARAVEASRPGPDPARDPAADQVHEPGARARAASAAEPAAAARRPRDPARGTGDRFP